MSAVGSELTAASPTKLPLVDRLVPQTGRKRYVNLREPVAAY